MEKFHHSIVRNYDDLAKDVPKRSSDNRCPLCPVEKFKPAVTSKLKKHLETHISSGIELHSLGRIVCGCHLRCLNNKTHDHAHYHCPYCPGRQPFARKNIFEKHWQNNHEESIAKADHTGQATCTAPYTGSSSTSLPLSDTSVSSTSSYGKPDAVESSSRVRSLPLSDTSVPSTSSYCKPDTDTSYIPHSVSSDYASSESIGFFSEYGNPITYCMEDLPNEVEESIHEYEKSQILSSASAKKILLRPGECTEVPTDFKEQLMQQFERKVELYGLSYEAYVKISPHPWTDSTGLD
ncbi:uncharacterized protein LOC144344189, partial [Saccoglossus kowalevskii]